MDVRLGLLRPKDEFHTMGLDINYGGHFDDETNTHWFFYHLPTKTEAEIDPGITKLPDDVVMIKVPDAMTLDPVGAARREGFSDTAFLEDHPLTMYFKAEVIPLGETPIADLVRNNLKRTQGIAKKAAPKRKGRKL